MKRNSKNNEEQRLPLSVVFEGRSWLLTALLEATTALWMVSLANDGYGFYLQRIQSDNGGAEKLANYVLYIVVAALAGGITFRDLSINFRPVESHTWRKRSCCSVFFLLITDIMAIDHCTMVMGSIFGNPDIVSDWDASFHSVPATVFLTIVGFLATLAYNWIFITEFGCCTCYRSRRFGKKLVQKCQDWPTSKDLPVAKVVGNPTENGSTCGEIELEEFPENEASGGEKAKEQTGEGVNTQLALHPYTITRCLTKEFIGLSAESSSVQKVPYSASTSNVYDTINEDEELQEADETITEEQKPEAERDFSGRLLKFFPNGLFPAGNFKSWSIFSWISGIWDSLKEEPGHFRYAVWIKSAFFTSAVVLIYTCISSISRIFTLVDDYNLNRARLVDNMDLFDSFLRASGWTNGTDSIDDMTVVKLSLIADKVIRDLKWASLIGFSLGAIYGLYGLIAVLAQHKRMSIAVSSTLRHLSDRTDEQQRSNTKWQEFQKKYPILGACFFLAILSSTAIIQLEIIGIVVSVVVSLLLNIMELGVIVTVFSGYFIAYIVAFVTNQIIFRSLKSSLITPDGSTIKYPHWFNFYLVILSMVHLVLGLLYALWRVLYLVITTILILNRLDVSIFTAGKSLDNGHNAFMSMLVLTVMMQQDSEKRNENKNASNQVEDSV